MIKPWKYSSTLSEIAAWLLLVVLLSILLGVLLGKIAKASPGSACRHTSECGEPLVYVADSLHSVTGHCAAIRILNDDPPR